MRRKIVPIPGNGPAFAEPWCLAFFGGAACSGATMPAVSGASAGAASRTFGGSATAGGAVASPADAVAAASLGPTAPEPVGVAWGAPAATDDVFAEMFADVSAVMPATGGAAVAFVGATGTAALCRVGRAARAEFPGLSPGAAAATEAGRGAGFADAAGLAAVTGIVAAAGETDGTAAARTLVTIARAAIGVFSGSLGRSMSERTTPAPAVAPIAVATSTMRAVRAKLGAGAK